LVSHCQIFSTSCIVIHYIDIFVETASEGNPFLTLKGLNLRTILHEEKPFTKLLSQTLLNRVVALEFWHFHAEVLNVSLYRVKFSLDLCPFALPILDFPIKVQNLFTREVISSRTNLFISFVDFGSLVIERLAFAHSLLLYFVFLVGEDVSHFD
jgi:hypothetical protein